MIHLEILNKNPLSCQIFVYEQFCRIAFSDVKWHNNGIQNFLYAISFTYYGGLNVMEFQKVLETRRTVRKYSAGVTREQMEELLRAAQEAPSWKNSQTGRYYCVLSEDMVDKIRVECLPDAGNAGKSEHAALIITTFIHDRAGFQKDGSADNELGNGWGCYDLGLQNENLILKATDLGLSTLIMGLREADRLREILNIPETETIVSVIAVGKAAEEPIRPHRKPIEEIAKFF